MRHGADNSFEHIRRQLKEAAQHGDVSDDFGADKIDDTAIDAAHRVERGAEDLMKHRKTQRQEARFTTQNPAAETASPSTGESTGSSSNGGQNPIKTKDEYVHRQDSTPTTVQNRHSVKDADTIATESGRKAVMDRAQERHEIRQVEKPMGPRERGSHADRIDSTAHSRQNPVRSETQTVKASAHRAKQRIKESTKGAAKTAQRSVKTAERTSQKAVKTARHTAEATRKTAEVTAKASQKAAQAARVAAKATASAAKASVKAVAAAVKAIIAATKSLIAAIAAGGWVAVAIVLVICILALIAGSCFGIFFSGEEREDGQTMPEVVREINLEYTAELERIEAGYTYDVLEMSGSRAVWKEVLSVYAVKTTSDIDAPQEVATVTDEKKQLLKDIFYEMNQVDSRTETKTETQIVESDDGAGNIIEEEVTVTQTYLYIVVSHKTADEMADTYGFNADQRQQLAELLSDENSQLWAMVLYGISSVDEQIVAVALSQVGNVGGEPYWSWYGFTSRVEWCACFVSWCANECGYIETGVVPKYAGCINGVAWFQDRDVWVDGSAEPVAGMIVFFDWNDENGQDGQSDHTGIVEKVEDGIVYTVEGNSGNSVREKQYSVGYYEILGYGILCV